MIRIFRRKRKTYKFNLFMMLVALMIWACSGVDSSGNGSSIAVDTSGTVLFHTSWASSDDRPLRQTSPSGNVCLDYGIDTIDIEIYDANGTVVKSQNCLCNERQATVSNIHIGSGMWLILKGNVAGISLWLGQSVAFEVAANSTTDAGTVNMRYIGDDSIQPEVKSITPVDGAENVSLDTNIVVTFSEDMVSASVVPNFIVSDGATDVAGSVTYDADTYTAIFTADRGLPESTQLTATLASGVEDLAGNQLASSYSWKFTSTSNDAPSVITLPADVVRENTARLNAQVNAQGLKTNCYFEYGLDMTYGLTTANEDCGAGREPMAMSVDISGLVANTNYHFRIVATSTGGTSNGANSTFRTDTVWAKSYGTTNDDLADRAVVQPTTDGGYILASDTVSFGVGESGVWIVKLDASGAITWEKTYFGDKMDRSASVQQTVEGGYVVGAETNSSGAGGFDYWILKINPEGDVDWSKTYGGVDSDMGGLTRQTSDGGFIVIGNTHSFGVGFADIWILKLNADGTIAWQKTYGGENSESATSIQQTSDGGYIVGGRTNSFGAAAHDIWILKLNTDGTIAWQKRYGGTDNDTCESVLQTADGGYVVGGTTGSFSSMFQKDIWILKLNSNGTVAWQQTYGGRYGDHIKSLELTTDGRYLVGGTTVNFGDEPNEDIWVLLVNSDSTIAWQKKYGGPKSEHGVSAHPTADGGYIVLGGTHSFSDDNHGDNSEDLWILKLGYEGTLGCGLGMDTYAVTSTPDISGVDTNAIIKDTSVVEKVKSHTSKDTIASVDSQCPKEQY